MAYLAVNDVRAEGVSEAEASDSRVTACIADASRRFEAAARTWFESRTRTYLLSGDNHDRLDLPQPCIALTSVAIGQTALAVPADVYLRTHDLSGLGFQLARHGERFPGGRDNITVTGSFGSVDLSDPAHPATPMDVKRAMTRWTILLLPTLTDEDAYLERRGLTAKSVTVPGRSMSPGVRSAPWSGDPEVDAVIARYRRTRVAVL